MDKAFSALPAWTMPRAFLICSRTISGMQINTRPEEVKTVWHSSTSLELGKNYSSTVQPDGRIPILDSSTRLSSSLLEEAVGLMALWLKASYSHSYFSNPCRGDGGFKCARQRQPRAVHIFQHAVEVDGCYGEWLSQ